MKMIVCVLLGALVGFFLGWKGAAGMISGMMLTAYALDL